MIAYIDQYKDRYGVEPICRVLPIAPSTYYAPPGDRLGPSRARRPAQGRDRPCMPRLRRLRVPQGLAAAAPRGIAVARCTVERLMGELGLGGRARGSRAHDHHRRRPPPAGRPGRAGLHGPPAPTSCGSPTSPTSRPGRASSTWPSSSTPSRRIVGWRVATRCAPTWPWTPWRWPSGPAAASWRGWCITSDRGRQYLSIRYTERLAEAGAVPRSGSRGDSYDNALAETIIGLYKTELIHRRGPGGPSTTSSTPPGMGRLVQPPPPPGSQPLSPTAQFEAP